MSGENTVSAEHELLHDGVLIDPFPRGHRMSSKWFLILGIRGTPIGFVTARRSSMGEWCAQKLSTYLDTGYGNTKEEAVLDMLRESVIASNIRCRGAMAEYLDMVKTSNGVPEAGLPPYGFQVVTGEEKQSCQKQLPNVGKRRRPPSR